MKFCQSQFENDFFTAVFALSVALIGDQSILNRRFRTVCYNNDQPNCNESFIDIYKNLSKSANNLVAADTYFWLFTNKNPDEPEWLHKCGGKLPPNSNFNPKNDLIVIISPYLVGICDFALYRDWIVQIFQKGEYNVLAVDWSWGSRSAYDTSIRNGKITAKQTAVVLRNIQAETGISKKQISLVGHSLAAHIAGWVGMEFPVGRITGLDPAGPGFYNEAAVDERLDPTDADFVDIWHCNAGDCLPYYGINYDAGDVDFWINGGSKQESCRQTIIPSFTRGDFFYESRDVFEDGERSTETADLLQKLTPQDLQHCFEPWNIRMQQCIDSEVDRELKDIGENSHVTSCMRPSWRFPLQFVSSSERETSEYWHFSETASNVQVDFWKHGFNAHVQRMYAVVFCGMSEWNQQSSGYYSDAITESFESLMPQAFSHAHCALYYKLSINPGQCQYVGMKCKSYKDFKSGKCRGCGENGENCILMGFDTTKYLTNKTEYSQRYYVETGQHCAYCDNSHLDLQGFAKTYNASLQTKQ